MKHTAEFILLIFIWPLDNFTRCCHFQIIWPENVTTCFLFNGGMSDTAQSWYFRVQSTTSRQTKYFFEGIQNSQYLYFSYMTHMRHMWCLTHLHKTLATFFFCLNLRGEKEHVKFSPQCLLRGKPCWKLARAGVTALPSLNLLSLRFPIQ